MFNSVQLLFYYCSEFWKYCFILLVNLVFWMTVLHPVQTLSYYCLWLEYFFAYCSILFYCWNRFENYFLFAFRSTCKGLSANVLSRVRTVIVVCIIAREIACTAWHGQSLTMAVIKLPDFFQHQLQFAWLRWSCSDWWHEMCPQLHTRKRLLIPIKSCVGSQYSVFSLVTTSCVKIGYFAHSSIRNKRTSEFSVAKSKWADTGTNDSGILQRSLRSVEPVCFASSHMAFFHMKPRGLLRRPFLPKVKHYTRAAPTLKIHIKRIEEAFFLPGGEYFSVTKMYLKRIFLWWKCFWNFFLTFASQWACSLCTISYT